MNKYFVVNEKGRVEYAATLDEAKSKQHYYSDCGVKACIFRNTDKGIEQAKKYNKGNGHLTLWLD